MNDFPDFANIVQQHDILNFWILRHYDSLDAWYEHIRQIIGGPHIYDKYIELTKAQCYERIERYQSEIVQYSEYLNQWSYSIVSRQVKIDLLYHHISVISSEERVQVDKENSKKKVVINKDLNITRV